MTDETPEATGLLLPEGTRLLHVGPHKTGTTSLQAALWSARPAMLDQGVRHVGKTRNPATAARAVTGQSAPTSRGTPPSIRHWLDLVGEFRRAKEPRVILSSESFAWARPEVIERIAADLDADRLHAVVTLRPLGRILPSQWQQNVQAGARLSYETWLRHLFGPGKTNAYEAFWWLHRHDELVARWADVLGGGRVTVIVVDDRDHEMLLRIFASLLGLREGTLAADDDGTNRSMTLEEIEAVRAFNVAAKAAGVDPATQASMMRFGAAIHMKRRAPGPDEARIDTPQWALDAAREADGAIVAALGASGVRVIGDLASLAARLAARGEAGAASGPVLAPARVAAEMAMGIALASGLARRAAGGPFHDTDSDADLARASSWQLAQVVARRSLASAAARTDGLRRVARSARRRQAPAAAPTPRAVGDPSTADRSLTLAEITAIRALRERWAAEGLGAPDFDRVVGTRVDAAMRTRMPGPSEATANEVVDGRTATAREVVADVAPSGTTPPEVRIPPAVSASMAMGVLEASGVTRRPGGAWLEPVEAARVSTRRLARIVAGRTVGAVTRRGPETRRGGRGER